MAEFLPRHPMRRWYDDVPALSRAIHISRSLPEGIRAMIARHLNEYIEAHRHLSRNATYALSLGSQRVMGMYRAASRRRWYDAEPTLHRAYTMMGSMPPWFLADFAKRILEMAQFLEIQEQQQRWSFGVGDTGSIAEDILMENVVTLVEDSNSIRLAPNQFEIWPEDTPEQPPGKRRHLVPAQSRRRRRGSR